MWVVNYMCRYSCCNQCVSLLEENNEDSFILLGDKFYYWSPNRLEVVLDIIQGGLECHTE